MIATILEKQSAVATADGIRAAFIEHNEELEWVAYFITGDPTMAAACVADAYAASVSHSQIFEDWLFHWARHATICTATKLVESRLVHLSHDYERRDCPHLAHQTLTRDEIETVVEEANFLIAKLDSLCRCALVLRGIEKRSACQTALLLGVSTNTVEVAYCAALEYLEVIRCEGLRQQGDFSGLWN